MSGLGAFAFGGAALIGWVGFGWWRFRRNGDELATARPGMTQDVFVAELSVRGADQDIASRLYEWISDYYGRETTPNADDLLERDIRMDPDDIEFFVGDFFRDNAMPMPTCRNPEIIPDYRESTLSSFALYLTRRRAALLNRKTVPT